MCLTTLHYMNNTTLAAHGMGSSTFVTYKMWLLGMIMTATLLDKVPFAQDRALKVRSLYYITIINY